MHRAANIGSNYQSRQWLADVGIDEVRSVSGLGTNTTFSRATRVTNCRATGGRRRRHRQPHRRRQQLVGGRLHRSFEQRRHRPCRPISPETPAGQDTTFTLNEAWSTPAGMRLSTSASIEAHQRRRHQWPGQDSTVLSLGAFGGGQSRQRARHRWQRALGSSGEGRAALSVGECLAELADCP